jgi:hypothetical protein
VFPLLFTLAPLLSLQDDAGFSGWLMAARGEVYQTEFLRDQLVITAGAREGITPSHAKVEEALNAEITRRIENAHLGDRAAWEAELSRLGQDEGSWRAEQRFKTLNTILINELVRARREITESEVIAAWEERFGPNGEMTTVRWIQVQIEPPTPSPGITRTEERALREAAREVARERAEEVCAAWRAGAEFAALRLSSGTGDEPAEPFRLDELAWPEAVKREVSLLVPGEISEPQAAKGGWSLFELVEKERTPLEEVREELTASLAARPANSAEADALFAELFASSTPYIALPAVDRFVDPSSSELEIGRIQERPIRLSAFSNWLTDTHGRPHLDSFKQTQLVHRLAEALGAQFSADEISQRMNSDLDDRLTLFYDGDRTRWLDDLRMDGRTLAGWRREATMRAHHDLCAEALLLTRRVVGEPEMRAEWERIYGPQGNARTVRWILMRSAAPPQDLKVEEFKEWLEGELSALARRVGKLRQRIVEDGEDFATLARRHSTDTATRATGGLLPGVFDPRVHASVIADAVSPLKSGEISQPVSLPGGCALYQVLKIEHTPFDEVRENLHDSLMELRPSAVELAGFVNQIYEESKR